LQRFSPVNSDSATFREACGARDPIRLHVRFDGTGDGFVKTYDSACLLLGRDPYCDLCLNHRSVGEWHTYLQVLDGQLFCTDLGSRSGTQWDAGNEGSGWLDPDRSIRIGPFSICNLDGDHSARGPARSRTNPLLTVLAERDPLPPATFDFLEGAPADGVRWRMRQTLALVGKSSRCRVQLGGAGVLPFHGALVRTERGVWFVDFGERTWVNGVAVRLAHLQDGDLLQIGKYAMRLTYERALPHSSQERPRSLTSNVVPPAKRLAAPETRDRDIREYYSVPVPVPVPDSDPSGTGTGTVKDADRYLPAVSDHFAVQVLRHCSMMQQQMAEQHQQVMSFLCEFLTSFRNESREMIVEEIRQFRQVTQELQALRERLAADAAAAAPVAGKPAQVEPDAGPALAAVMQRLEALETQLRMAASAQQDDDKSSLAPVERPPALVRLKEELLALESQLALLAASPPASLHGIAAPALSDGASLSAAEQDTIDEHAPAQDEAQPVQPDRVPLESLQEGERTAGTISRPQDEPDPEVIHSQLMSRMTALQNEQQTHLQKILRFVRGSLFGEG
jgi:pSer/pThr/pTyr-binding forkhead associated (FHA) protein